jgi:hypothetical protein
MHATSTRPSPFRSAAAQAAAAMPPLSSACFDQRIVDDLPLPGCTALVIHRDLVAMPRFDRREVALAVQSSHRYIARPALRPRRGIALRNFRAPPSPVLPQFVQIDSHETRGQDFVASVAVPVDDVNAVHYAFVLISDQLALPLTRP